MRHLREADSNTLVKAGVPVEEIIASLYEAVVYQNLATLTKGNTPLPEVLLLGGPNLFFKGLQRRGGTISRNCGPSARWRFPAACRPSLSSMFRGRHCTPPASAASRSARKSTRWLAPMQAPRS